MADVSKKIPFSDIPIRDFGNTIQITGMVLQGPNQTYIAVFPDEHLDSSSSSLIQLDMGIKDFEQFLYQSDVLETEMLWPKHAIVRKSQRQIDQNVTWKVFRRDSYTCRYCGRNDIPLSVDHVVRWEDGGPTVEDNLVSSCRPCNRTRGNLSYRDWIASPVYKRRSVGLDSEVHRLNLELLNDLPRLEGLKVNHVRSR